MTIGEGIASGGLKFLDQKMKAAELAERAREADQSAFVSLANAPKTSDKAIQSAIGMQESQRQYNLSRQDALDQQARKNEQTELQIRNEEEMNAVKKAAFQAELDERQIRVDELRRLNRDVLVQRQNRDKMYQSTLFDMMETAMDPGLGKFMGAIYDQGVLADFAKKLGVPSIQRASFGADGLFTLDFTAIDPSTGGQVPVRNFAVPGQRQYMQDKIGMPDMNSIVGAVSGNGKRSASGGAAGTDAQKLAVEQGNKQMEFAQKQLATLQAQRKSLVESNGGVLDPNNPELKRIDGQMRLYNDMIVASLAGGADKASELSRIYGIDFAGTQAGEGASQQPRKARQFENEKEIEADKEVRQGGFLGMGGRKVPQIEDDTRTGEKVINTDEDDGNGGYRTIRLKDGDMYWDNDGNVVYREGNQVFTKPESEYPIRREQADGALILIAGGKEVYLPKGKVFKLRGRNYKVDGEEGHLGLVATDEPANWGAEDATAGLEAYRKGEDDRKRKAQADEREKERERKRKEEEQRQKDAARLAPLARGRYTGGAKL